MFAEGIHPWGSRIRRPCSFVGHKPHEVATGKSFPVFLPDKAEQKVHSLCSEGLSSASWAEEVNSRPSFFFGEVFIIVILSTGFEKAEKWLRTRLKIAGDKIGREILDALFREITILGFIGLLLFVLTHLLPEDTPLISLGADEYNILPETFEYVHMATFLLLVVLLFQGFAVLKLSRETAETWAEYESTRAFGKSKRSMETKLVEAGYLKRVDNPFSITGYELQPVKNFGYGDTPLERVGLRTKEVHKLIMWRSIRHGFLFDGPQSECWSMRLGSG